MALTYQGSGKYITGIPARDLTGDELSSIAERDGVTVDDLIAQLTSRGLYAVILEKSKRKTASSKADSEDVAESEDD